MQRLEHGLKRLNELVETAREQVFRALVKPGAGTVAILFGLISLVAPLLFGGGTIPLIGIFLIVTGILQIFYSYRRIGEIVQRSEASSGRLTLLAGLLVCYAPAMVSTASILVVALLLGAHGVQAALFEIRKYRSGSFRAFRLIGPLLSLGLAAGFLLARDLSARLVIGFGAAYWQFAAAWALGSVTTRDILDASAGGVPLPDNPELRQLARTMAEEQSRRRPVDRSWIAAFLMTLFAIHVGRMENDWDLVGMIAPGVALLGDAAMALLISYIFIFPTRLGFQRLTRSLDSQLWGWVPNQADRKLPGRLLTKCVEYGLRKRLLFAIRMRQARYSISGLIERGLQTGLPIVAVIVATAPIWGMSWYFDTENWAAGIWNDWAETRTMTWREAMVEAVSAAFPDRVRFQVSPAGVDESADFSFIVIGDTGEGDASQLVLKDQIVIAGQQPRVKFLVLSSDVIYPSGEMSDYEAKFFLPFKGFRKPIYAIPGNHDWYDALEGFAATFFRPDAARAVMRARIKVDQNLTTTRNSRIEAYIKEAQRLRSEYEVQTGYQDAPFFRFEAGEFSLFAVDTGVAKRVDAAQFGWLENALEEAGDRFKMVILGHPLYAGGFYQAETNEDFASIHALLRKHRVDLVMAGDTHDLEYYKEIIPSERPIYHFVNGGGGAYLSFGTALGWPRTPATESWAFYPNRQSVAGKLDRLTPLWKRPLWYWAKHLEAWPFSPEALSALFDYNVAPFFQSFMEICVEPSMGRVRLIPYGIHGPLRWSDLQRSADLLDAPEDQVVEFEFPMRSETTYSGRH
jgi:uncharacterized membrane protein HdeD (DUF308 family)